MTFKRIFGNPLNASDLLVYFRCCLKYGTMPSDENFVARHIFCRNSRWSSKKAREAWQQKGGRMGVLILFKQIHFGTLRGRIWPVVAVVRKDRLVPDGGHITTVIGEVPCWYLAFYILQPALEAKRLESLLIWPIMENIAEKMMEKKRIGPCESRTGGL